MAIRRWKVDEIATKKWKVDEMTIKSRWWI